MTGGQRSSDVVVPAGAVGRVQEGYAELCCRTNYSFLEGASHPDELVRRAAGLGHRALAVTDVNSLAGVVRAHVAACELGEDQEWSLVCGARLRLQDAPPVVVWVPDREGYAALCRLLTLGRRRAPKGSVTCGGGMWLNWAGHCWEECCCIGCFHRG